MINIQGAEGEVRCNEGEGQQWVLIYVSRQDTRISENWFQTPQTDICLEVKLKLTDLVGVGLS